MDRKPLYHSLEDLVEDLDNESLINDEDDLLDSDDIALLHGPKAPAPKPKKARKGRPKSSKK